MPVCWTNRETVVGTIAQESGVERTQCSRIWREISCTLRPIVFKIREEHDKVDNNVTLKSAVKALTGTMGPKGLAVSYLVFGCIPRFLTTESTLTIQ